MTEAREASRRLVTLLCAVLVAASGCGGAQEVAADSEALFDYDTLSVDQEVRSEKVAVLILAIRKDLSDFKKYLLRGDDQYRVQQLSSLDTQAGVTLFPRGADYRFYVYPKAFGHDGYQVSVDDNEIFIRSTHSGRGGGFIV
ncbi:MAG: hypothetical protein ACT4TC_17225, partial [Myxococcaceae bacterium]